MAMAAGLACGAPAGYWCFDGSLAAADEIATSMWSLGRETLERNLAG